MPGVNKKAPVVPAIIIALLVISLSGCGIFANSDWKRAQTENTVKAYEDFIKKYPDNPLSKEAQLMIEKIHYGEALSANKTAAYESFINKYPSSPLVKDALLMIEKLVYEEIVKLNSPGACRYFLRKYPGGKYSGEMQERLLHLLGRGRKPGLGDVKNIKIVVDCDGPLKEVVVSDVTSILENWAENAGLKPVREETEKHDAVLRADITGSALGASYSKGFFYTGAVLKGTVSITGTNGFHMEERFYTKQDPPFLVMSPFPDKPEKSPLKSLFFEENSLFDKTALLVGKAFGPYVLVSALDMEKEEYNKVSRSGQELSSYTRSVLDPAARAAVQMGGLAVEPLIGAALNKNNHFRTKAIDSLGALKDERAVKPLTDIYLFSDSLSEVAKSADKALAKIKQN